LKGMMLTAVVSGTVSVGMKKMQVPDMALV
jgi:hypothetical protein